MILTLGFSPCPNDTFIFDAMIHNRVDTEGLTFLPILEDVETLNQKAFDAELDMTKLSYFALAHVLESYALLYSGSALGNGVGPLLVAKKERAAQFSADSTVAIPGKFTTANFLFSLAYPTVLTKKELVFHQIEDEILRGSVDAGVIIHENRFTYAEKGLVKIQDLGEFWESTTQKPIPLGGIVVKRDLPQEIKAKVQRVMARSVQFAFDNPKASAEYVAQHAQEMNAEVRQKHIDLYVNEFTKNLNTEGVAAVNTLLSSAFELGLVKKFEGNVFFD